MQNTMGTGGRLMTAGVKKALSVFVEEIISKVLGGGGDQNAFLSILKTPALSCEGYLRRKKKHFNRKGKWSPCKMNIYLWKESIWTR